MSTPLVSVLITAYNREKYIAEAIESVLAQTMTDFELIIVDDCSSDRTVEIAKRYTKDPRIRIYINLTNLGDYPNRNRAAEIARGKYLKYLDSDDMMYPQCLDIMVYQMELFPRAGIGFSKEPFKEWVYPVAITSLDAYRLHFLGCGALGDGPSGAIIKRVAFNEVGGFPVWRHISDIACWLKIARKWEVLFTLGGLINWRVHPDQESVREETQNISVETAAQRLQIHLSALDHEGCPLSQAERILARRNYIGIYLRIIGRDVLHGRLNMAIRRWQLSKLKASSLRWTFAPSKFPYRMAS